MRLIKNVSKSAMFECNNVGMKRFSFRSNRTRAVMRNADAGRLKSLCVVSEVARSHPKVRRVLNVLRTSPPLSSVLAHAVRRLLFTACRPDSSSDRFCSSTDRHYIISVSNIVSTCWTMRGIDRHMTGYKSVLKDFNPLEKCAFQMSECMFLLFMHVKNERR